MNEGHLSERMAAVRTGRAAWTPDETAHLAACAECREELELLSLAGGIGLAQAAAVDSDAVARAVLPRLREARRGDRFKRGMWATSAVAVAAVLMLVVAPTLQRGTRARPMDVPAVATTGSAAYVVPVPELDGFGTAELQAVLQALDSKDGIAPASDARVRDLDDLDAQELQSVLDGLEG